MSVRNRETSPSRAKSEDINSNQKKVAGDGLGSALSEEALLVEHNRRVDLKTAVKLRTAIIVISYISIVYLTSMGIFTLVVAVRMNNSSSFAFALDALLDSVSSAVVIWRYSGNAANLYSPRREKIACIVLGSLFIVSSVAIIARSGMLIREHHHTGTADEVWMVAIVNSIVCLGLFIAKVYIAAKLESISIATDAVNSGIGFITALSVIFSDLATSHSLWYLDSTIGIICAVFLLAYGIWVIIYNVKTVNDDGGHVELLEK